MDGALLPVANAFHAGAYDKTIGMASMMQTQTSTLSEQQRLLGQCYLLHAQLAIHEHQKVKDVTATATEGPLRALFLLSQYLSNQLDGAQRGRVLQEARAFAEKLPSSASMLALTARSKAIIADIFMSEGLLEECMRLVAPHVHVDMECAGALFRCYTRIHRLDLCANLLMELKKMAEDASLTLQCEASLYLKQGAAKIQDAFYVYQELLETYGSNLKLLNNQAVALMSMHEFAKAEKLLSEAYQLNQKDPVTLAHLMVCARQLRRPMENVNMFKQGLFENGPRHPVVLETDLKSSLFDRLVQKFAA